MSNDIPNGMTQREDGWLEYHPPHNEDTCYFKQVGPNVLEVYLNADHGKYGAVVWEFGQSWDDIFDGSADTLIASGEAPYDYWDAFQTRKEAQRWVVETYAEQADVMEGRANDIRFGLIAAGLE